MIMKPLVYWNGKQAVCKCPAYDFPHRFGGGDCNGYFLAKECHDNRILCGNCELVNGYGCEVMEEQTQPGYCPYVEDFCNEYQIKC